MILNDSRIKALTQRPSGRYEVWDSRNTGFGLRVSPTGSKSFIYRYQLNGKRCKLTIGSYPDLSLGEARKRYLILKTTVVADGHHPNSDVNDHLPILTEELFMRFDESYLTPRRKNPYEDRRLIRRNLLEQFGNKPAEGITPKQAAEFFQKIASRAPVTANRLCSVTNQMFEWGIGSGLLEINPFRRVKRPGGRETPRERVLSDREIKAFWHGLVSFRNLSIQIGFKLLLVTAQRRGELSSARWADIDFGERSWHIPQDNSKNRRGHNVPLSPLAFRLFQELRSTAQGSPYIFPSRLDKERPILPGTFTRSLNRNIAKFGIDPFTVHDLRRTARTGLAKLKVDRDIAEMILNHRRGSIIETYDHYSHGDEMKKAMDKWGSHLEQLSRRPKKQPAAIVDIDGTISDPAHRLHFVKTGKKDWKAFFEAIPNDPPI
ncbi:MAG: tyrosine-type recombinase/integrase, partial [SAR324 cluster bacterium]|nr:tyrosine-type recombinase/integrase [SAR324 cluster bacterium]